ncbi:MAG: azr 2 [Chitinophagaceae bacterium]|nr:azr 2 [Chitinophagaceae bacterium]
MNPRIKITGISGSLRDNSSNTNILRQLAAMIPAEIDFTIYNGIGGLPHFNPELDGEKPPIPVESFRQLLKETDAVIICTPEYAFGVPGSLKNALDWTVSSGELVNKPLALITASLSGGKAHAALLDTLTALSTNITEERSLLISFIRSKLDEKGFIKVPELLRALQTLLRSLAETCRQEHNSR